MRGRVLGRRRWIAWALVAASLALVVRFGNDALAACEGSAPSRSEGTPSHGRLSHGRRLPTAGANFRAYSYLGTLLGRNTVHQRVRDAVLEAYASMHAQRPDAVFVYGEAGWPRGGRLWPHRTHENGLSVDFLVPVVDGDGRSVPLPSSVFSGFGYGHDFDAAGREGSLAIDFGAMAAHLAALDRAARRHGLAIRTVIFDPALQPRLFAAPGGAALRAGVPFLARRAWVRHDEHYHVDFELR